MESQSDKAEVKELQDLFEQFKKIRKLQPEELEGMDAEQIKDYLTAAVKKARSPSTPSQ